MKQGTQREGGREEGREGGREEGRKGMREGGREGTRGKPGNQLVLRCILWACEMHACIL